MQFDIITIFPNIFNSYFSESILKRAQKVGLIEIKIHDLRDYAEDKHKKVDDTLYGGGAGMLLKVKPFFLALKNIKKAKKARIILFSAKGKRYTQKDVRRLAKYDQLILLCGRYEGVDERVAKNLIDEEISVGDFVLTGGEIPAMLVVDSVARLLPGVLGNQESAKEESHSIEGQLEFPQYTKPEEFNGWQVPKVLLSGNHKEIEMWRQKNSKIKKP